MKESQKKGETYNDEMMEKIQHSSVKYVRRKKGKWADDENASSVCVCARTVQSRIECVNV